MPRKTYSKTGTKCRVTFEVPAEAAASHAVLLADFNDWQPVDLTRRKDGRFSTTLSLESGRAYEYRFLLDGERWYDDPTADDFVPNTFGTQNAVVRL